MQGDFVGCFCLGCVRGVGGVFDKPIGGGIEDGDAAAGVGQVLNVGEFGGAVARSEAALGRLLPGEGDQGEFTQGAAEQDHVKLQGVAYGQLSRSPVFRLDEVGGGRLAKALNFVVDRGRGKDGGVGAGVLERAALAFFGAGHAGEPAQGVAEGAAQHRAGPVGQVNGAGDGELEAVAGEGEHGYWVIQPKMVFLRLTSSSGLMI